jgi:hypothetical protein
VTTVAGTRVVVDAGARPRRTVLAVMVLFGVGTFALGTWGALRWSLIPDQIDGTIAWSSEAKDGPPWRELVLEGGAIKTIDTALLERMGPNETIQGQSIHKEAWSRDLVVDGRPLDLSPSPQFWRTSAMFTGLVTAALARLALRFRSRRREPDRFVGDD